MAGPSPWAVLFYFPNLIGEASLPGKDPTGREEKHSNCCVVVTTAQTNLDLMFLLSSTQSRLTLPKLPLNAAFRLLLLLQPASRVQRIRKISAADELLLRAHGPVVPVSSRVLAAPGCYPFTQWLRSPASSRSLSLRLSNDTRPTSPMRTERSALLCRFSTGDFDHWRKTDIGVGVTQLYLFCHT